MNSGIKMKNRVLYVTSIFLTKMSSGNCSSCSRRQQFVEFVKSEIQNPTYEDDYASLYPSMLKDLVEKRGIDGAADYLMEMADQEIEKHKPSRKRRYRQRR